MSTAIPSRKTHELFRAYYQKIRAYLADSSEANRQAVLTAATRIDTGQRGMILGRSSLASKVSTLLQDLKTEDTSTWAKFLSSLCDDQKEFTAMQQFSPFKDSMLAIVEYGCGFVTLYGAIQPFLDELIRGSRLQIYKGDTYVVVLPEMKPDSAKVIWIKNDQT